MPNIAVGIFTPTGTCFALEPEKVPQRELKQSSWAAEVMADEHAISARCPGPPVDHDEVPTAGK